MATSDETLKYIAAGQGERKGLCYRQNFDTEADLATKWGLALTTV